MNTHQKHTPLKITKNPYLTDSEYLIDTILVIGIPINKESTTTPSNINDNLEILSIIHRDSSSPFIRSIGTLEDILDRVQIIISRSFPKKTNPLSYFTFQQKDPSHQSNSTRFTIFYYTYFYKNIIKINSNVEVSCLPRTICIISQFACPGFFRELCMNITSDEIKQTDLPLEVLLTTLVHYLPPPMKSKKMKVLLYPMKKAVKLKESTMMNDKIINNSPTLYGVNVIPTFDFALAGILDVVEVQKFSKLYMLLFTSIDICIFSEKDEVLNSLGNTLLALTYPFIFDSALEEYTVDLFFDKFMPPNSVDLEKRIHIIHGAYNKSRDRDRLKLIFPFVAVYDLDESDLFYLTSDSKRDSEEEKKQKKKIFEQVGNNKNKQVLIGPFINKLEDILNKLCQKAFSHNSPSGEGEGNDNCAWKYSDIGTTNKNFQDVCYSINMWLLSLLLYHERQKEKDPKGKTTNLVYSFAFREKDLCKGEKEYFISFIEYFKCFLRNIKKYFTSIEDDRYKSLLQLNTNEKLTLIMTEEISFLYSTYFSIQKQAKSNFSLKEKDIEELPLSILKEVIEEEEIEREKEKEKEKDKEFKNNLLSNYNQSNQIGNNDTYIVEIFPIAEAFYLQYKSEIDQLKVNKTNYLEQTIINKCQEIIKKDTTENNLKTHEAFNKQLFYEQISFQDISSMLERKILSESRFKTELTDYLHLTLLIVLSMFVHDTAQYKEILTTIAKYHKLFLRKYLTLILEQYSKGLKIHPDNKNISEGIKVVSQFIYNEDIPRNEELKLYIQKGKANVVQKEKEKKESKYKEEPIENIIKGVHKLELRENYCKDKIYEEETVSAIYNRCIWKGGKEVCINCEGCGYQIKPKIYMKFIDQDSNEKDKQVDKKKKPEYKRIKCLVESIQMIYEKSLTLIGNTNINKEDIHHVLVNLFFYYWKKVTNKTILQFLFDTIKNVEYSKELPNKYQV